MADETHPSRALTFAGVHAAFARLMAGEAADRAELAEEISSIDIDDAMWWLLVAIRDSDFHLGADWAARVTAAFPELTEHVKEIQ